MLGWLRRVMMKAKTLLGLVVLATVALWALTAGCVTEEEVEQAPTPTPWPSPGAPGDRPATGPTPIPASEQLPVTVKDIQQATDGTYFVPDRGDGCSFQEVMRQEFYGAEWVLLGNSRCALYWRYAPSTGEVAGVPVVMADQLPTATPSGFSGPTPTPAPLAVTPKPGRTTDVWGKDIKLGGDGNYSRADTGDGCGQYREVARLTDESGEWVYLQSPTCEPDVLFSAKTGNTLYLLPNFRLGPDGKYLMLDPVGCNYREVSRSTEEGRLWIRLESPTHCRDAVLYGPTLGQQRMVPPPSPTPTPTATPPIPGVPRSDPPSPSEIKLGPDGKYFIPDRGDGCPWTESGRMTFLDGTVDISFRTECDANFSWSFRPQTGEVFGVTP